MTRNAGMLIVLSVLWLSCRGTNVSPAEQIDVRTAEGCYSGRVLRFSSSITGHAEAVLSGSVDDTRCKCLPHDLVIDLSEYPSFRLLLQSAFENHKLVRLQVNYNTPEMSISRATFTRVDLIDR
jgi:hypothetical protein